MLEERKDDGLDFTIVPYLHDIIQRCNIYVESKAPPSHKIHIIERHQHIDYLVGPCFHAQPNGVSGGRKISHSFEIIHMCKIASSNRISSSGCVAVVSWHL